VTNEFQRPISILPLYLPSLGQLCIEWRNNSKHSLTLKRKVRRGGGREFQVWFLWYGWDPNSCFTPLPVHWWRIIRRRLTLSSDSGAPSVPTQNCCANLLWECMQLKIEETEGGGEILFLPLHRLGFQFNSPTKFLICNNWISVLVLKRRSFLYVGVYRTNRFHVPWRYRPIAASYTSFSMRILSGAFLKTLRQAAFTKHLHAFIC
jgi:hypothetical protein